MRLFTRTHWDIARDSCVDTAAGCERPRKQAVGGRHARSGQSRPPETQPRYSAPEMEDGYPTSVANNVWQAGLLIQEILLGGVFGLRPDEVPDDYADLMGLYFSMLRESTTRIHAEQALSIALEAWKVVGV